MKKYSVSTFDFHELKMDILVNGKPVNYYVRNYVIFYDFIKFVSALIDSQDIKELEEVWLHKIRSERLSWEIYTEDSISKNFTPEESATRFSYRITNISDLTNGFDSTFGLTLKFKYIWTSLLEDFESIKDDLLKQESEIIKEVIKKEKCSVNKNIKYEIHSIYYFLGKDKLKEMEDSLGLSRCEDCLYKIKCNEDYFDLKQQYELINGKRL
jgi:hypothetical protein